MKVTTVGFNSDGDGIDALYIDGHLYSYGDYYHNKQADWQRGFIDGLKFAWPETIKGKLEFEEYTVNGDYEFLNDICDGDVPSQDFANVFPYVDKGR